MRAAAHSVPARVLPVGRPSLARKRCPFARRLRSKSVRVTRGTREVRPSMRRLCSAGPLRLAACTASRRCRRDPRCRRRSRAEQGARRNQRSSADPSTPTAGSANRARRDSRSRRTSCRRPCHTRALRGSMGPSSPLPGSPFLPLGEEADIPRLRLATSRLDT